MISKAATRVAWIIVATSGPAVAMALIASLGYVLGWPSALAAAAFVCAALYLWLTSPSVADLEKRVARLEGNDFVAHGFRPSGIDTEPTNSKRGCCDGD